MHACVCVLVTCTGVATLTVRELFDFAVDPTITDDNIDAVLDKLMETAAR